MSDAPADSTPAGRDYRETVFLPETPFPMRGGLPQKEPLIIEQCMTARPMQTATSTSATR
jgi:isoleucyl-tRNA synthetase